MHQAPPSEVGTEHESWIARVPSDGQPTSQGMTFCNGQVVSRLARKDPWYQVMVTH